MTNTLPGIAIHHSHSLNLMLNPSYDSSHLIADPCTLPGPDPVLIDSPGS